MKKGMVWMMLWMLQTSLFACGFILNNPYPAHESQQKIFYTSFTEQPRTLDPAKAYSINEYQFIAQVYEPVLQYDYLTRPYQLVPLTAASMPEVTYYDKAGHVLHDSDSPFVAESVYTIHIKPGVYYQPHPAFAKDKQGRYRYYPLPPDFLDDHDVGQLADFKKSGTRELVADDYIYQIKRLANPRLNSPVYGLLSHYLIGFREFKTNLPKTDFIDLRTFPLKGVQKRDDYTFDIHIKGVYPQFLFWLAMPFFSPVPWEADRFYAQPGMGDKNLDFDWYPVGTGPFMLSENNPNRRMVLDKNPNFHAEFFPTTGTLDDQREGYLTHAGERLPLIDRAIYTLEKEAIPRWNKFIQGYYDLSGVNTDSFDQAIQMTGSGHAILTANMRARGVRLTDSTEPLITYMGFNMLDNVVGGKSERARLLRQAISIAINYDENIAIFYNGRGQPAQGPIPPGVFGYREGELGINKMVYKWNGSQPKRRAIAEARALMKKAGYPNGRDPKTGKPLILHYDVSVTGGPDDKAQLNWMQKQFARLGIALNIRDTQYNRFEEKLLSGNAQIFSWSWSADYPDPENFLFLLYGANGKVAHGGENATNYHSLEYDRLFDLIKNRHNDDMRLHLIDNMLALLRFDAPWVWGIYGENLYLSQPWISPVKRNTMSQNTLKYVAIDVPLRHQLRCAWNQPVLWPIALLVLFMALLVFPIVQAYRRRELQRAMRE